MMISRASGGISALLAASLLLSPASTESGVRVDPMTQSFVDSTGRSVLFHGINVVGKNSRNWLEFEISYKKVRRQKSVWFPYRTVNNLNVLEVPTTTAEGKSRSSQRSRWMS